jgi:radial spoke head protein 1
MIYNRKGEYFGILLIKGHFENGIRHGEGVFTYLNKDVYSGWFKWGKKEGKGTYIFNDTGMRI